MEDGTRISRARRGSIAYLLSALVVAVVNGRSGAS
jgi:hypothetical protein